MDLLIGTYTTKLDHVHGIGNGIYVCTVNASGQFSSEGKCIAVPDDPSYLCTSSKGEVFCVSESKDTISVVSNTSTETCSSEVITFSSMANYFGGSVVVYDTHNKTEASETNYYAISSRHQHGTGHVFPGKVTERQEGPHAHQIRLIGNRVFVPDLGMDSIEQYHFDPSNGNLTYYKSSKFPDGSGPRHIDFLGDGTLAFVSLELTSEVAVFRMDVDGFLENEPIQILSTVPDDIDPSVHSSNSTSHISVHPSNKFVYVANRGHDSICCFVLDADSSPEKTSYLLPGKCYSSNGLCPRNFCCVLPPDSAEGGLVIVANQNSHNLVSYQVDMNDGSLNPSGELEIPSPVCIVPKY